MERVKGKHLFQYDNLEKKYYKIIENILYSLNNLHSKKTIDSNVNDLKNVYIKNS